MVSPVLSSEVRRFCQTTSVRGIPRIVNSKSTAHSVIWLLGVLTCTSVLIWQVVVVFIRYRSYPVNTVISQSPEWDNATFPDITICNLCSLVHENDLPISYSDYILETSKQFTLEKFMNTYRLFGASNITKLAAQDFQSMLGYFGSPTSYIVNFPLDKNLTKKEKKLPIIDCSYFNWDYSQHNYDYDCIGSIDVIRDPDFYKCYTLKLNDTLRKSTRGFSAIVYVEDILDNVWMLYNLDIRNTRATGMKVLIHEPGSKPNMKLGIGIKTGESTTLTLHETKITRLPEPYSNCTSQSTLGSIDESLLYTQHFCKDVCIQEQYLRQCGCLVNIYQFTDSQLQRANNSICGRINIQNSNSSFDWNGVKQILCVADVTQNKSTCHNECPLPCEELHYEPKVAANSWPHVTSQLSFYMTYINGTSRFGESFGEYLVDYKYNFINKTAAIDILEKLNKDRLIQDNFLQLNIQFNSNAYQQEAQAVAFSTDAFGAQLGGVLSLWLGVTILLIFEVCEFIISLLSAIWSVQRNKPPTAKESSECRL